MDLTCLPTVELTPTVTKNINDSIGKLVELTFAYRINGCCWPIDFRQKEKSAPNTYAKLSGLLNPEIESRVERAAITFFDEFDAIHPKAEIKKIAWVSNKKDHELFTGVPDANSTADVMIQYQEKGEIKYFGLSIKHRKMGEKVTIKNVGHNIILKHYGYDLKTYHNNFRSSLADSFSHLGLSSRNTHRANKQIYKQLNLVTNIEERSFEHKAKVATIIYQLLSESNTEKRKQFLIDGMGLKPTVFEQSILQIKYDEKNHHTTITPSAELEHVIKNAEVIDVKCSGNSVDVSVFFGKTKYFFQINVKNQSGPFSTLNYPARYLGKQNEQ